MQSFPMSHLMLKDLPRYECLLAAAERYPSCDPSASEAFLNLLRTADLVFAEKGKFLAHFNISQGRFTVLMLLTRCKSEDAEGWTPASLAEKAGVTRATMTGLLDTLEKDGLVLRESDPADRRVTHVTLTPQGETLIEALLPSYFQVISDIVHPLSENERKVLVNLLGKLQDHLDAQKLTRFTPELTSPLQNVAN